MRDFVTKKELADRHNVKIRTIDNWIRTKNLPFYKFGSDIVFKDEELEVWGKEQANIFKRQLNFIKKEK